MCLKNCVLFSAKVVFKCDIAYLFCPIFSTNCVSQDWKKAYSFTSVLQHFWLKILKKKYEQVLHFLHMKHI